MALAGSLEIALRADVAQIRNDMAAATGIVQSGAQKMEAAAAQVGRMFAALGVSLGAGAIVAFAKSAIDAADKLNDLSKSTGIAVEQLAGLQIAAKQSGGDLDSIAASINKLSVNIGQNSEKFKALGITTKDTLEAYKQFADIFAAIRDPQLRAALGAEAIGKSWAGAAPLLAEGGAKMQEMIDKGARLSRVTKEIAEQSDAFNDKLVELTGTGGIANSVLNTMLPLMNLLADGMVKAGAGADDARDSFNPLLEIMRALIVVGGNVVFVFKGIGNELGGMAAQLAALATGDFAAFKVIRQEMIADAEKARIGFDRWEASVMKVGTASQVAADKINNMDQASRRLASITAADARAAAEAAEKRARAFLTGDEKQKKSRDELAAYKKRMEELEFKSLSAALQAEEDAYYESGQIRKKIHADYLKEIERLQKANDDSIAASIEARIDRYYEEGRTNAAPILAMRAHIAEIEKMTAAVEVETSLMGLSTTERLKRVAAIEAEKHGLESTGEALKKYLAALDMQTKRAAEVTFAQKWIEFGKSLEEALTNAFLAGRDGARQFLDWLKAEFLKTELRPLIKFAIGSALGGMGLGSGTAAATDLGPIFGTVAKWITGGGDSLDRAGAANRSLGDTSMAGLFEKYLGSSAPLLQGIAQVAGGVAIGLGVGGAIARAIGGDDVRPLHSIIGTIVGSIIGYIYGGAAGAMIGGSAGGSVGGIIDGALNDGPARREATVGYGARDYTYGNQSGPFGGVGIMRGTDKWFSDDEMGGTLKTWFRAIDKLDKEIAKHFSAAQVNQITSTLASQAPIRLDFGMEHTSLDPETFATLIKQRYGAVFSVINQQMADLIANFTGSGEELITLIVDLATVQDRLTGMSSELTTLFGQSISFADIARLKGETEGYTEALQRLAGEYSVTNRIADMLGKTQKEVWGSIGLASEAARARLIQLAGGIDNLSKQLDFYYTHFYTTQEQQANTYRSLNNVFKDIGVTMPETLDDFRALTDSYLAQGEAGAETAAKLLAAAPAYYAYIGAIEAVKKSIAKNADEFKVIFGQVITVDDVRKLQQNGEKLDDTLKRITSEFTATNELLRIFGMDSKTVFGAFGLASQAARAKLIELSGGIEAFTSNLTSFYDKYFSAEEKRTLQLAQVNGVFTTLGITMPTTTQGFRELVQQQLALGPAGAVAVAALLGVNAQFYALFATGEDIRRAAAAAAAGTRQPLPGWRPGMDPDVVPARIDPFMGGRQPLPGWRPGMEIDGGPSPETLAKRYDWQQKLEILMGTKTQKEVDRARELASVSDDATKAIMRQVYAQEDLNEATLRAASNVLDFGEAMDKLHGNTAYSDQFKQWDAANSMQAVKEAMPWIKDINQLSTMALGDFKQYSAEMQKLILAALKAAGALNATAVAAAAAANVANGTTSWTLGSQPAGFDWVPSGGGAFGYWKYTAPPTPPDGAAGANGNNDQMQALKLYQQIYTLQGFAADSKEMKDLRDKIQDLELAAIESPGIRALTEQLQDLQNAADDAAEATRAAAERLDAMKGIADWLKASVFSANSPLTAVQQLEQARKQYSDRLGLAQDGDIAALRDITRYADQFLSLERQVYGGGGEFSAMWAAVQADLQNLADPSEVATAGDNMIADEIRGLREEVRMLRQENGRQNEMIIDTTRDGAGGIIESVEENTQETAIATGGPSPWGERR